MTRALAPGASRTRRRRLTIGSSTAPTVLESGWPSMTDIGVRIPRPRTRNRARSVSYCSSPTVSLRRRLRVPPRPRGSPSDRGRRVASRAPSAEQIPSAQTDWKMPGGPRRLRAARGRFGRTRSARSLGFVGLDLLTDTRRTSASCSAKQQLKRGRDRAIAPPDLHADPRKKPLHSCPVQPRSVGMRPTRPAAVCVTKNAYVPQASRTCGPRAIV